VGALSLIKFSWSSTKFEELELHGEQKGGEDVKGWDDEVILQSSMIRDPPTTTMFLLE
jgi:hypothetical protein